MELFINDNWSKDSFQYDKNPGSKLKLSDEDIDKLIGWCESNDNDSTIIMDTKVPVA